MSYTFKLSHYIPNYAKFNFKKLSTLSRIPNYKPNTPLDFIETPSLVIDKPIFETNLKNMKSIIQNYSIQQNKSLFLMPHYKASKSPNIAKLQLSEIGGAHGLCVAKLFELESLLESDIDFKNKRLILTNQLVHFTKINRLNRILKKMKEKTLNNLTITIDSKDGLLPIINMIQKEGYNLDIYIELNVGQDRCGLNKTEEVIELVKLIKQSKQLNFLGLMAYHGGNQHTRSFIERKAIVESNKMKGFVLECIKKLKELNIQCHIVSGGGTGSFQFEIESGVYNEVQPGSYIFMDKDYLLNQHNLNLDNISLFQPSLFIYTRIQSITHHNNGIRLILDAGTKAINYDSGMPIILINDQFTSLNYINQGDEHGCIELTKNDLKKYNFNLPKIGEIIKLLPSHCDPTVNLYDYFTVIEKDQILDIWPITGRGPGL